MESLKCWQCSCREDRSSFETGLAGLSSWSNCNDLHTIREGEGDTIGCHWRNTCMFAQNNSWILNHIMIINYVWGHLFVQVSSAPGNGCRRDNLQCSEGVAREIIAEQELYWALHTSLEVHSSPSPRLSDTQAQTEHQYLSIGAPFWRALLVVLLWRPIPIVLACDDLYQLEEIAYGSADSFVAAGLPQQAVLSHRGGQQQEKERWKTFWAGDQCSY